MNRKIVTFSIIFFFILFSAVNPPQAFSQQTGPVIDYFDLAEETITQASVGATYSSVGSAPVDAYVTVYGQGFGPPTGSVKIGNQTAEILEWKESYWRDQGGEVFDNPRSGLPEGLADWYSPPRSKVTFKVPQIATGSYSLTLTTAGGQTAQASFKVRTGNIYCVSKDSADNCNWNTIKKAISSTSPTLAAGDIVYVRRNLNLDGSVTPYNEGGLTIGINKSQTKELPITFQAYPPDLVDKAFDQKPVIITGSSSATENSVIYITANYINLIGFKVTGAPKADWAGGIMIVSYGENAVTGIHLYGVYSTANGSNGILVEKGSEIIIRNCNTSHNSNTTQNNQSVIDGFGIWLNDWTVNSIIQNTIANYNSGPYFLGGEPEASTGIDIMNDSHHNLVEGCEANENWGNGFLAEITVNYNVYRKNIAVANRYPWGGAGIWLGNEKCVGNVIEQNILAGNPSGISLGEAAGWGGAIPEDNTIRNNLAVNNNGVDETLWNRAGNSGIGWEIEGGSGAGINILGEFSKSKIYHNTIVGNYGGEAGGVVICPDEAATKCQGHIIENNIIANNYGLHPDSEAKVPLQLAIGYKTYNNGNNVVDYNLYYDEGSANRLLAWKVNWDNWSDCSFYQTFTEWQQQTPFDQHSLFNDPLFISTTDFHLKDSSSAKDKGITLTEVTTDFDGVARPQGSAYDIGAYEYLAEGPTPTPSPACQADLNQDGIVSLGDLAQILNQYGSSCAGCPEDLNEDGIVNLGDLAFILQYWGQVCP